MEENQVEINVGDPLKDLYNEFNPKLNLAKSYDEFKATMQDSSNRKAFFDEFNPKLNLANDFNQFENVLGLKKKDGTNVSGNGKLQFPSLDSKLFEQANIKPVSESTSFGRADIIDKAKMVESLPFVRDKAIHDKTIKNLLQKGKLAMQGSNSYNEEKQNVSNTLKDEEWMPSAMLPVEKDYVKNKAINTFSKFNNESTKSIEDKINSGDYIIENGKVKVKGGIADNFGQGIKDFVDGIGLSLNVAAAQSRGNNNEIKYYMNEFNKNKEKDKEFAAVGLPEKASKVVGEMSPYAITGVLMPYADIPLMGLSNLSSNHQAIWNDDKMTMDQKVDAINNTTKDAFMTGNLQGAAFNMLGISDEKVAKDLLKRYEPTQKLYNNFKDVIKTVPSDVSKAAAIGGGTEFLNNLTKNKEGVKVDFGSIPKGALSMATLELIMKAPKVFTSGFKTLNEAIRTGYDKENPNWYNKYSKDVQDVLNQIVSSPEPVYNKLVNLLDVHPDAESQLAKQKIETFRDYYKSLPADLDPVQKNKALHILQLKTEAISDAQGAQDVTIRKSLENKASAYDNILQKVINKEPLDENKEPLLLSRFAAPIKEENIEEVKPIEVVNTELKGKNPKGNSYDSDVYEKNGVKYTKYTGYREKNGETRATSGGGREMTWDEFTSEYKPSKEQLDLVGDRKPNVIIHEIREGDDGRNGMTVTFDYGKDESGINNRQRNEISFERVEPKEEVKPTGEEITVYHGGSVKDLSKTEGGLFVSADKAQAEAYAKGNNGNVQEFKINKKDISNESEVRKIIVELGLKSKQEGWDLSKELMMHEILDPRFETSLSKDDLNKLYTELEKRGYKAIEMGATDITSKKNAINDILVLNPKETLKSEVKPTEVKETIKTEENAIQEPSTREVLQRPQEGIGEAGSERKRVEPSVQGIKPTEEGKQIKVNEEKPVEPKKENEFLYTGTDEQRKKALLKNLMESDIPKEYKAGLEEKGLTYKVSNQVEASEAAKAIINSLGVNDALEIARSEKIDPSVGSAIYAESLNNLWSNERKLKAEGKSEEAKALAKQWSDVTMEYADKLNSKGKWTAQTAYFYKTSPMGFAIRIENERVEQFADWFEAKEKDYKKVFNEIIQSEEGQALLKEEVEKVTKAERVKERQKRDKSIDDFFEKLKLKGGTYATIIPPNVWNAAVDIMKVSVKAGDRIVIAVQSAIDHIDKELKGAEWDKEKFRNDYESQLNKVTGESVKEKDNEKVLLKRISELKRRLEENDFSAEEYKAKRTLSEKEQLAKDEYDKVKKLYDEAKKESPEYIDKKAKQYLDKLRKRLKGISEEQKEDIIRRSIKEIVSKGGLEYDEFKDIVSEVIGIKKLSDEQKAEIETLTEQSNIADELEQKFLDNPTRENIDAFKKAKAKSLEADRKLFEMTSQKADIVGTLKSLITLNYLGASTLIKNFAQNVVYQGTVRFPISLAKKGIDQSVYGATYMGNKMFGTKVIKPSISLTDAQRGYFKEYREGVIRGWEQMIKGVDEKDYFSKNQYASSLNPSKSVKELKASMRGEIFLTPKQKVDKWIQATLGWQPYAISRGMIYGDKPPRYAAQGAEAMQIAHKELGINTPLELEAFMTSPEKYAYKHLVEKAGLSSSEASKEAKSISKRIVDAGSVATFQNENYFNDFFSKIDEFARVSKEDKWTAKIIKPPIALIKASQLPFLKTPANVAWAYFKIANPALTMTKSLVEAGLAQNALRKGDLIGYKEYSKNSKESFGMASIGIAITAGAAALAAKGLIRTSVQEEDKARERAGEGFFGKSNELNMGALLGGDDYWVDLSAFGPVGTIIDMRGRMMEDNKQKESRGEKIDDGIMNEIVSTMGYSVSSTLNTLVFDQGAKIVDALSKGNQALNQVIVNNANALGNIVLGGTIPAINKALAPEKADLAADNLIDQIINNQKQKNVFVTWAAGYPPSKVSIWGEPITQDKSISGFLGTMLGWEKGSADKFGSILYNEQRRTGKNEFFPPVEDKKIKVNGKDVQITTEEKRDLDTYIGQARKNMVSPFINDKTTYTVFLKDGKYGEFTYSELTAGKNKDGLTIDQNEADRAKLAALDVIYQNGKKAGFSKFKEKYVQYQDATMDVQKITKQAYEGAEKTMFKAKIEAESK